jgi:hypothetical protein
VCCNYNPVKFFDAVCVDQGLPATPQVLRISTSQWETNRLVFHLHNQKEVILASSFHDGSLIFYHGCILAPVVASFDYFLLGVSFILKSRGL